MLNDLLNNLSRNTKIVIVSIIIIIIGTLLFVLSSQKRVNDNTDGEYQAPNVPAFLVYNNNPYSITQDPISENFIKVDLAIFARTNYQEYSVDNRIPVELNIDKLPDTNNNPITIKGEFNRAKSDIILTVKLLENGRIKLSITDTITNTNVDESLTSNSAENQFIGTLPINEKYYNIAYEQPDIVSISAFFRDPTILEEARDKIKELVGEETLNKLNISISYPTAGFNE